MTNWVANRWDLSGPEGSLDAAEALLLASPPAPGLLARLRGARPVPPGLDFERVLPSPSGLQARALDDWRLATWGTSRNAEGTVWERSPGRVRARFATPWSHPAGVVQALAARLPPDLVVEGAYVEEGNEVAGRFRIEDGRCEDREVPYSDAFFCEVTGEDPDAER